MGPLPPPLPPPPSLLPLAGVPALSSALRGTLGTSNRLLSANHQPPAGRSPVTVASSGALLLRNRHGTAAPPVPPGGASASCGAWVRTAGFEFERCGDPGAPPGLGLPGESSGIAAKCSGHATPPMTARGPADPPPTPGDPAACALALPPLLPRALGSTVEGRARPPPPPPPPPPPFKCAAGNASAPPAAAAAAAAPATLGPAASVVLGRGGRPSPHPPPAPPAAVPAAAAAAAESAAVLAAAAASISAEDIGLGPSPTMPLTANRLGVDSLAWPWELPPPGLP